MVQTFNLADAAVKGFEIGGALTDEANVRNALNRLQTDPEGALNDIRAIRPDLADDIENQNFERDKQERLKLLQGFGDAALLMKQLLEAGSTTDEAFDQVRPILGQFVDDPQVIETIGESIRVNPGVLDTFLAELEPALISVAEGTILTTQAGEQVFENVRDFAPAGSRASINILTPDGRTGLSFDDGLTMQVEGEEGLIPVPPGSAKVGGDVIADVIENERIREQRASLVNRAAPAGQPAEQPSIIPEGISGPAGVGFVPKFFNAINALTDAVSGRVAFPNTEDARNALITLKVATTTVLQDAVDVNRTTEGVLSRIERLTVEPLQILQSDARAKSRFAGTKQLIDAEIARISRDLSETPDLFTNAELSKAATNLSQMISLSQAYGQIIDSFVANEASGLPIITTQAEYDDLPLGTKFLQKEGGTEFEKLEEGGGS